MWEARWQDEVIASRWAIAGWFAPEPRRTCCHFFPGTPMCARESPLRKEADGLNDACASASISRETCDIGAKEGSYSPTSSCSTDWLC